MAVSTIASIPEDLLTEILIRLPVKTLIRVKCVCKFWCALINDPIFIYAHRNWNQKNNPRLLLNADLWSDPRVFSFLSYETLEIESVPSPIDESPNRSRIGILGCGSVDGILCVVQNFSRAFLWNPATRELKALPSSDPLLVCPPRTRVCYNAYGFGYDRVTDDYKVVRTARIISNGRPKRDFCTFAEVYSLRSDYWRKLDVTVDWDTLACLCQVYLNGVYHWISLEGELISLDMSTELFCRTYPPIPQLEWIFAFHNSVATTVHANTQPGKCFEVWTLGELGVKESWTKLFTIGPLFGVEFPIGFAKNGDFFFRKNHGHKEVYAEVVWCDPNTQVVKDLGVKGYDIGSAVVLYSESLVSLQGKIGKLGN